MDGLSNRTSLIPQNLRLSSRQVVLISTFTAIGAVVRIGVDESGPTLLFAVVIKTGLSERVSLVFFVYGSVAGFATGFLIILISEVMGPFGAGAWTSYKSLT